MSTPTLAYRHATNPSRGLAATGIIPIIKMLLALPHLIIVNALQYLGYRRPTSGSSSAFTGQMPGACSASSRS
jgi:hypothetical protein